MRDFGPDSGKRVRIVAVFTGLQCRQTGNTLQFTLYKLKKRMEDSAQWDEDDMSQNWGGIIQSG